MRFTQGRKEGVERPLAGKRSRGELEGGANRKNTSVGSRCIFWTLHHCKGVELSVVSGMCTLDSIPL